ncbi:hypothetical protein [Erwinia rhapontici]|uniref:hypothetical protein n=1 Tax=Erwinia rhapontici TaxID=55212 RepID=UPI0013315BB0|nr:hypothetical protein [Erwinia rhapontici]MBP2153422.1 hypothetical protein [Erwinia rhapontici]
MTKATFFNDIKDSYVQMMASLSSEVEDELLIDEKSDVDEVFYHYLHKLNDSVVLLKNAKSAGDELTVQAALVYIRVYSIRLSGFFEDIKDDTDTLLKLSVWPDMPENYQVPEHYKFPHK